MTTVWSSGLFSGWFHKNTSWAKEKSLANVPQTYWSELLKLIDRRTFWIMSLKRHTSADVAWLSYNFWIYSHGNASEIIASWRPWRVWDRWIFDGYHPDSSRSKVCTSNSDLWEHFSEANRDWARFNISVQGSWDMFSRKTQPKRCAKCQISSQNRLDGPILYPVDRLIPWIFRGFHSSISSENPPKVPTTTIEWERRVTTDFTHLTAVGRHLEEMVGEMGQGLSSVFKHIKSLDDCKISRNLWSQKLLLKIFWADEVPWTFVYSHDFWDTKPEICQACLEDHPN